MKTSLISRLHQKKKKIYIKHQPADITPWCDRAVGRIISVQARGLPYSPHLGNGYCSEVTSCAPSSWTSCSHPQHIMFYSRHNHRSPSQQLSDRMSSRSRPQHSALVPASSHIHEDLTGNSRGTLRCTLNAPGLPGYNVFSSQTVSCH